MKFPTEICNQLKEYFKEGVKERKFSKDTWAFKSDFAIGLGQDNWLFVEIENAQPHPDTNVSKYWTLLDKNKDVNITLIQIFGKRFLEESKNDYRSRLDLCKFIADKIHKEYGKRFIYSSKKSTNIGEIIELIKTKAKEISDKSVIESISVVQRDIQ